MRTPILAMLALAATLSGAGCTTFEERLDDGEPCTADGDCKSGTCSGHAEGETGTCLPATDAQTDEGDATPDVLDVPEFPDAGPDEETAGDAPTDEATVEAVEVIDISADETPGDAEDIPDADGADIDGEEVAPIVTGEPCASDGECQSGLCVDPAGGSESLGHKVCTGPCTGDGTCPYGMACVPKEKAAGGSSYVFECVPFPRGLCTACGTKEDCPTVNAQCLYMTGGTFCGAPCPDLVCPSGFHCVTIETPGIPAEAKRQCVPQFGTCACIEQTRTETFDCTLENVAGTCTGTIACDPATGWGRCNSFLPEAELCDGLDNNCDDSTDEGFTVTDWNGTTKGIGDPCGIGECAGGHVECTPSKNGAICSTEGKKLAQELCGDNKDNNCDGSTDEKCYAEDIDGDGDPNETDCAPWDAARHHTMPGGSPAVEPCCPASVPPDQTVAVCDYNCDKIVTTCSPNDKDRDGHTDKTYGGDDCDDGDPTVYPGAPEKCDDGIDQDCDGSDLHCCNADAPPTCQGPDDLDNDGWPKGADCNDNNKEIRPYATEYCNYKDDDCDGVIDEGNPGGKNPDGVYVEGGSPCGLDAGECKPGKWVCMHYSTGVKMECVGATGKSDEVCDGKDNDCNGATDETFPDKGKACDGDDLDSCKNGKWTCLADGTGLECVNEVATDLMEVCDGKSDKDCDGTIGNGCFPEDLDGDGYTTTGVMKDCDDRRSEFHPNAKEPCCDPTLSGSEALDTCDRNCDGHVTYCDPNDKDMDGHVAKGFKDASGKNGDDCDDNDPNVYPGAPEKCGDGIVQDCAKSSDIPCPQVTDDDGDGYSPPADCNDDDPKVHPGAAELCNDQDDDCDGATDDGNAGGGAECGSNLGECVAGVTVCVHYQYSAKVVCVPIVPPAPDLCDGKDNNCNGKTDEYFPLVGAACDGPDEDKCLNGVYECSPDGKSVVCGAELVQNIVEVCDGKDNDCDGLTDEGYVYEGAALGSPCEGLGECGAGVVECAADRKHATCSTNPDGSASEAKDEICNGLDDDCDGVPDDGVLYQGQTIGSLCLGIGTCGLGIVECAADGTATCSSNPNGSKPKAQPELCNGLDDDCDGHADESPKFTIYDCRFQGVCMGGAITAACRKGKWDCDYSQVAGYEDTVEWTCDGLDNNCDGKTDESYDIGAACDGPDSDQCKNGKWVCGADLHSHACDETGPGIQETCNGADDDCDGATDEDFLYQGIALGSDCDGLGECGAGKVVCSEATGGATCSTNPDGTEPQGVAEACNGLDDDCDGSTDEDFPVNEACAGPGSLCFNGHYECDLINGGVTCIGWENTSTQEICDGKDNDCDGATDNGFEYFGIPFGQPCLGIGQCGVGTVECATDALSTCSTNPDGSARQDTPEVCDGLDNDCDGTADEDLTFGGKPLGAVCTAPGVCGEGTVVCSPTGLVATCSTAPDGTTPGSSPEVCDGLDNDCNGTPDDGMTPDLSGCKLTGVCNAQKVTATCNGLGWVCDYSQVPGYMAVESGCDGLDNDCDGITDNGYTYLDPTSGLDVPVGGACDGIGACGAGTVVCAVSGGPKATCSTNPDGTASQAKEEICTATGTPSAPLADEDCDGLTDEEGAKNCTLYYKDVDGDLHGQPGVTKCYCKNKQVAPYTAPIGNDCNDNDPEIYTGHPEVCDDKDNNCNGLTDEGTAFVDKGKACDGDDPDLCANGKLTCSADGLSLVCTGDYNSPETCNGIDDDCNGLTDETFSWGGKGIGQSCDGIGECGIGVVECLPSQGAATCSTNPDGTASQAKAEKCNAKDDDCDGSTDEDFPDKNLPCDGIDADQCKQGTWTCKADGSALQCINEPVPPNPPTTELCDNVDNDCNTVVDDPWVGTKGTKCNNNTGEPVPCATGVQLCKTDGSGLRCVDKDTLGAEKDCVFMAKCRDSGDPFLPDECRCQKAGTGAWGDLCTQDIGSTCDTINAKCMCGGSPACVYPKKCQSGVCQ